MAIFEPEKYTKCEKCGKSVKKFTDCKSCEDKERLEGLKCPVCKSDELEFHRTYQDNGIIGPGFLSYPISEHVCCKECGVLFLDVSK